MILRVKRSFTGRSGRHSDPWIVDQESGQKNPPHTSVNKVYISVRNKELSTNDKD